MQDQFVEQPRRHLARAAQPVRRAIRYSGVVTGVGVGEIVTRTICSVFCIGLLLSALSFLSAVNTVKDTFQALDEEIEDVDCFTGAAVYAISVSSLAIAFHILAIITRIVYLTLEKCSRIYAILNGIVCVFFVIFLLIGGVSGAGTSTDTFHRSLNCISDSNFNASDICNELERVSTTAAITAILGFLSMILFGVLFLIMLCYCCAAKPKLLNGTQPESQVDAPSPQPTNGLLHNAETGSLQYNVTPTAPNSSLLTIPHDMYASSPSPPSSPTDASQLYGPLPSAPTPSVLQSNASQLVHVHVLSPCSSHSEDSLTSILSPVAP